MIFLAACFIDFSLASSFSPGCALPPAGTNYVSGPNTRGTFTIFWNNLLIIIICTWNILHLNIPAQKPRPRTSLQRVWWAILDSHTKVKWMLFTILMPEFLVGKAFNDWMAGKATSIDMAEFAANDGVEWDRVHSYFCNMGGFIVDFSSLASLRSHEGIEKSSAAGTSTPGGVEPAKEGIAIKSASKQDSQASTENAEDPAQDRLVQLIDGVLISSDHQVSRTQEINLSRLKHTLWALDGSQMSYARSEGIITTLPNISTTYLDALSKGDALVKFLAIVQVSWLIIQLIARKIAGLPSSQLEIATLAFSASSLITYLLFWRRPKDLKNVIKIPAARFPNANDLLYLSRNGPRYLWTGKRFQSPTYRSTDLVRVPNDSFLDIWNVIPYSKESLLYYVTGGNEEVLSLALGAIIGGTVFGCLHCLAWNFHFPTVAEKILWRTCSILLSALPILSISPMVLWARYNGIELDQTPIAPWKRYFIANILIFFFMTPYFLSRLFIMVEIFRSLFFLPPEVFIETWSQAFPH